MSSILLIRGDRCPLSECLYSEDAAALDGRHEVPHNLPRNADDIFGTIGIPICERSPKF
jgi:hypothetical protein